MATIKDVAKKAGVSISTASYALNDLPNVHKDTKKRILDAAKELNYTPNATARNLKTKRTGNIGVFIYGFAGPIFGNVLDGVHHELQANGYNIVVSSGKSSAVLLKERQIDAAIIFDSQLSDDILIHYANLGHPVILLDRYLKGKNIYSSVIDNKGLVYQFIEAMIKKGYKTFGYMSGPSDSFNNIERYEGFQKALADHNIKDHDFYDGDFTIRGGFHLGKKIALDPNKPQFIYCANDELAIGLIQAFNEKGVKVPVEVGVAGFDNIYIGKYIKPELSTITIDYSTWGESVAKAVVRLLQKRELKTVEQPKGELKLRASC